MSRDDRDLDLAKRAKVIEWLKTELIDQISRLFKGTWEGSMHKITDSLASIIVCCYVLGRRIGLSYRVMDEAILEKLNKHRQEGHQLEDWYKDISALEEHMHKR